MGFYWTSLSALYAGLSVWNPSESAWNWCRDNECEEFAPFFNRHAGQTHAPIAAPAAPT